MHAALKIMSGYKRRTLQFVLIGKMIADVCAISAYFCVMVVIVLV